MLYIFDISNCWILSFCSSLLKKRNLESVHQKDDDDGARQKKKKKTKVFSGGHGKDSKKLKKHKKHPGTHR